MIVRPGEHWHNTILALRGSAFLHTWPRIAIATLLGVVAIELSKWEILTDDFNLTALPFSLIGVALAIFLGFRNNETYGRFWEGRKLWGALVNTTRTWSRQVKTFIRPKDTDSEEDRAHEKELERWLVLRMVAYVYCFRNHLRDQDVTQDLEDKLPKDLLEALKQSSNAPYTMVQEMGAKITEAYEKGWVDPYHLPALDQSLTNIMDIQGGCERIKSTPIPYTYSVLIHRLVACYCFFLPFGIVTQVNMLTPVVTFLIALTFFGLDDIGEELMEPFGLDDNDLPLSAISRMIEVNLKQDLGLDPAEIPPLLKPEDDILL